MKKEYLNNIFDLYHNLPLFLKQQGLRQALPYCYLDEDGDRAFGYNLEHEYHLASPNTAQNRLIINLNGIDYEADAIFKDEIWWRISLVNPITRQWHSIRLDIITKGWVNPTSITSEDKLKLIENTVFELKQD